MSNFTFDNSPVIRHRRSRFDISHGVKTTANVGTLYPFDVQEVYAGDTFKVKTSLVSRLTSQFLRPVMDNLFIDTYYFFVPSRLVYDKFPNVFGENTESAWANSQEFVVPKVPANIATSQINISSGTVADYLGLPLGSFGSTSSLAEAGISVLPFRCFAKIYDDWFRDENIVAPMHIQKGPAAASESLNNSAWSPSNYCGKPPKVGKFHDYFTSCLPSPQKGNAPAIPLAQSVFPVGTSSVDQDTTDASLFPRPLHVGGIGDVLSTGSNTLVSSGNSYQNVSALPLSSSVGAIPVAPSNLVVDIGASAGFNVNDLRYAFAVQKMLERDARSGTRYVEYLKSHFGVFAGDSRLQRSEFLGGRRTPISIHQVTQTTGEGSSSSPLGSVGAWSLSNGRSGYTKSFVEHGYVLGVFCIRQFHTYQQGVEKFWTRFKRTDFYDPVFANLGEQPVMSNELYANGSSNRIFGYNEAWADLRYRPNKVTGQCHSGVSNSLDVWHFADNYSGVPTLNSQFIEETPTYVDRAITVNSSSQDQFILDFWIHNEAFRAMPTYSIPSLIDHN